MPKRYNTPHSRHVVKTRMTDEEYADFTGNRASRKSRNRSVKDRHEMIPKRYKLFC